MSFRISTLFVSTLTITLLGCGGGDKGEDKNRPFIAPPAPKEAPKAPPKQNVAVDKSLAMIARQEVKDALRSSDPLVRSQGLECLRGMNDADAAQQIVHALNDREAGVRFGAAMMAGELKVQQARPVLERMVKETDPNVAVAVRYGLHKLGNTKHTHDLEEYAVSTDPRVRRNVALVLGSLGEKSAVDKVLNVLRADPDPLVRQQALEAMWRLGDEKAIKPLVALTVSSYSDDRIIGLLALAGPKRQNVREHVRGLLAGDDIHVEVSLVAARAMGMLGSDEGYVIAKTGARSQDPQHRFLAAMAFGAIGRPDAQDDLRKLLSDPEPNVQLAAAAAILQLGSRSSAQEARS
jgi:HEAT repeat protein